MTISNQWFGLVDSGLVLRATTADDTSTAWAANSAKELAISKVAGATATSYTVKAANAGDTAAQMWLVCNVKATVPTLAAVPITVGASALAPQCGNSNESTVAGPDTTDSTTYVFAATTGAVWPYAYVVGA